MKPATHSPRSEFSSRTDMPHRALLRMGRFPRWREPLLDFAYMYGSQTLLVLMVLAIGIAVSSLVIDLGSGWAALIQRQLPP